MNILHNISVNAIRRLINSAEPGLAIHSIVVDYDGEVIIDPELKFADIGINRYKYCTHISNNAGDNEAYLNELLENLSGSFSSAGQRILNRREQKHRA